MAYNEQLADRIRVMLAAAGVNVTEKKMFSGLSFLVDGKICVSVAKNNRVLLRLSPEDFNEAAETNGVEVMTHGGKMMKGYVYINAAELNTDAKLKEWVDKALAFNPFAKPSKSK